MRGKLKPQGKYSKFGYLVKTLVPYPSDRLNGHTMNQKKVQIRKSHFEKGFYTILHVKNSNLTKTTHHSF